jgi:hypothetical protein
MTCINFEDLLGKHISYTEKITGYDFEETNVNLKYSENKHYSIKSKIDDSLFEVKYLCGIPYKFLFIQTDKTDIVQSITIYFQRLINRAFYDAFNEVYGIPSSMLVIEKRTVISENNGEDETFSFQQHLRKSELELREGTFEENPLHIVWEKKKYMIKALLRHNQNISEITFSLIEY